LEPELELDYFKNQTHHWVPNFCLSMKLELKLGFFGGQKKAFKPRDKLELTARSIFIEELQPKLKLK
jgi:hypothetical protein